MLQAHLITQTLSFFSSKTVQLKYTINSLSLGICISPVNIDKSQYWPLLYHNPLIAHKLLHGFRHGFSLKLTGTRIALCCKDMVSATDNQNHLLTKLQKEILLDRIFGLSNISPISNIHCNSGRAFQKTNGWSRITNLSSRADRRVNNFINLLACVVKYSKFRATCFDLEMVFSNAFRLLHVPVRP